MIMLEEGESFLSDIDINQTFRRKGYPEDETLRLLRKSETLCLIKFLEAKHKSVIGQNISMPNETICILKEYIQ